MTPRALLLALTLLLCSGWPAAGAQTASTHHDTVETLRNARVLVEPYQDTLTPPDPTNPQWRDTPTAERQLNPSLQLMRVWFAFQFQVHDPVDQPWALLLTRLYSGGTVFLNGLPVGEVASSSPVAQANWLRPHQFTLAITGLRQGTNTLLVAVPSRYGQIGIGLPSVGPQDLIQPLYERRHFWEYTVALVSVWLLMVAAFCLLAIWLWRRQEVLYGLFGLAILAWGIRTIHHVWTVIPLSLWVAWRTVYYAATGFGVVLLCMFVLRAGGLRWRWAERLTLAYAAIGPLATLLLGGRFEFWEVPWYAGAIALIGITAVITWYRAATRRTTRALALTLPASTVFIAFLHDYIVKANAGALDHMYIAHAVAPMVVLIMCLVMLVRFVQSLNRVEGINHELEQRVRAREAELHANHESLLRMELRQASSAERQRIMQDMHDGLGSQLLSSLAMVERGGAGQHEVAQVLRESIDDMRLVLDALSPDDCDLLSALGTLRYRMAPRLAAAGIALEWQIDSAQDSLELEPRHALAVLRIVQEGIANVFKHSRATRLSVHIATTADALRIDLQDNGCGFAQSRTRSGDIPPSGHGLTHMRRRAAAMGAELDIASATDGTRISLRKPLVLGYPLLAG